MLAFGWVGVQTGVSIVMCLSTASPRGFVNLNQLVGRRRDFSRAPESKARGRSTKQPGWLGKPKRSEWREAPPTLPGTDHQAIDREAGLDAVDLKQPWCLAKEPPLPLVQVVILHDAERVGDSESRLHRVAEDIGSPAFREDVIRGYGDR